MKVAGVYALTSHQATCEEGLRGAPGVTAWGKGFQQRCRKAKGKHQPGAQLDIVPMSRGHWGLKEDHPLLVVGGSRFW